jgi:hypothetical protein
MCMYAILQIMFFDDLWLYCIVIIQFAGCLLRFAIFIWASDSTTACSLACLPSGNYELPKDGK